jgi:hypothetical protein
MSLSILIQQLTTQPDIDKSTLIQIIHKLTERINKLETKSLSTIINLPPSKESYTEFIQHIEMPKIEQYLDNLPKLLIKILTNWLNKKQLPIILHNQSKIYIYTTYWRPLVNNDLNNLYNYIVKQITIQLSKWQTEHQNTIIKNEKLYDIYSTFILSILSHQPKKIKFIKETIKELLVTKTSS